MLSKRLSIKVHSLSKHRKLATQILAPRYTVVLLKYLRAFSKKFPLIFEKVELKCFDVVGNSSQTHPGSSLPLLIRRHRENSDVCERICNGQFPWLPVMLLQPSLIQLRGKYICIIMWIDYCEIIMSSENAWLGIMTVLKPRQL